MTAPPPTAIDTLAPAGQQALLRRALALGQAPAPAPLRGRNIALLCAGTPDEPGLAALELAAARLGGRVARIDAAAWLDDAADTPQQTEAALRLLERLYDAVDCEGLPEERARALQRRTGLPVFIGLARPDHAVRRLLPQLRELRPAGADDELHLVQALLLNALER
ncbi:hypothetical protein G8A07_15215 [Roseateles sp. DAIF2]|uniref:hypothetical protein n=1 Tax=Roseateles sp. DAIF2 TaxID=2714952 RepID=UPI0018A24B67|nr:hypothetical protein [Roseateles sp. DAIF2]QPF74129.1 hypothetical protein G8A07_15215 [Roseateles sp. DAIF2]